MAIAMNNSANITYNFAGQADSAVSNIATTSLTEEYSLKAEKLAQNVSWRPSENLTYIVKVQNDGVQPIYAISVQDDLGGAAPLLTLVGSSVKLIRGDEITDLTPTSTSPLTVVLPDALAVGETVMLTYIARVKSDIAADVTEITNTATVAGHEVSDSGPVITVTPPPERTLPRANYADVRITKTADKAVVSLGDQLTYVFRLENAGNTEATSVVIRDTLPENFTLNSVKSVTDGVETVFETTDYSVDTDNKLILPTSTTKTISVPAATAAGYGVTVVTLVGTITA